MKKMYKGLGRALEYFTSSRNQNPVNRGLGCGLHLVPLCAFEWACFRTNNPQAFPSVIILDLEPFCDGMPSHMSTNIVMDTYIVNNSLARRF